MIVKPVAWLVHCDTWRSRACYLKMRKSYKNTLPPFAEGIIIIIIQYYCLGVVVTGSSA